MKIEDRLSDAMHEYADAIEPAEGSWDSIRARFDDGAPPRRPVNGRRVFAGVAITLVVVLIAVLAIRDDGPTTKVATGPVAAAPMPSRILAIAASGQPVVLDAVTGDRQFTYGVTVAEGTQVAVTADGQVAYVVIGDGNEGCADHAVLQLQVGAGSGSRVVANEATSPTVSPDGRYLAFLRCVPGDARASEIVLRDLTTGAESTTAAPTGTFFINRLEFAGDSRHILFDLYEDATRRDQIHEIDVVAGATPPGPVVGPIGWAGVRGVTGEYLQWVPDLDHGLQSGIATWEPSSSTATIRFDVPTPPTQVVSDRSGRHLLAVADGALYRWSEGDQQATKVVGSYTGAAWIPDAPELREQSSDSGESRPIGVLASTTGGALVSMDSASGAIHETLAALPGRSSVIAVPPDGLQAVYGTVSRNGPCAEPRGEVGTVDLASESTARIVSGVASPIVSPDGRFVAYGIQCDGFTLGFSDLRDGMNYRTDPFPDNVRVRSLRGIDPIAWAPDSERILFRVVFDGSEDPTYWIGRLWPSQGDAGGKVLPDARLSAAAFVDDSTLAIAADHAGRSRVRYVDLKFQSVAGEGFEVPGRIERLTIDASGRHFLAVTLDGSLYRWSTGDKAPTKLAD